jgi:hypothetical protein
MYVVESGSGCAGAVSALVQAGFAVEAASDAGSGLEELFLRLTEGAPR